MQLRLCIYDPVEPGEVAELLNSRTFTRGAIGTNNGLIDHFVQVELDGAKGLTQLQWEYLSTHRYVLSFVPPIPDYTEEEEKILDSY